MSLFLAISECETPLQDPGHFLELLASSQARRLDDQRVSLNHFPGLRLSTSNPPRTPSTSSADQIHPQGKVKQCTAYFFSSLSITTHIVTISLLPVSSTDTPHTPSLYSCLEASAEQPEGDDVFFDMLVKCQVRNGNPVYFHIKDRDSGSSEFLKSVLVI